MHHFLRLFLFQTLLASGVTAAEPLPAGEDRESRPNFATSRGLAAICDAEAKLFAGIATRHQNCLLLRPLILENLLFSPIDFAADKAFAPVFAR